MAAYGTDLEVHPFLAESITANDDFTEWTIAVRPGITFHDGTPLDADAMIYNLQATGTGLLVAAALTDLAKVPSAADPAVMELKIEKVDDMTFTIFTGQGGDPDQPLPWPNFPAYLTGQWGLIASPTWLEAVVDRPSPGRPDPSAPVRSCSTSYAPRDRLVVTSNPDYWMTDAAGTPAPLPRRHRVQRHRGSGDRRRGAPQTATSTSSPPRRRATSPTSPPTTRST